jgi:hypothetical protein
MQIMALSAGKPGRTSAICSEGGQFANEEIERVAKTDGLSCSWLRDSSQSDGRLLMAVRNMSWDYLVDNRGATISAAIFSDPQVYQQELEQVFARMWLFVGHECQIPNPGDFVRSRMGEEQVIVTRGKDNDLLLLNPRLHRATWSAATTRSRPGLPVLFHADLLQRRR